jgi:hypothetical protein
VADAPADSGDQEQIGDPSRRLMAMLTVSSLPSHLRTAGADSCRRALTNLTDWPEAVFHAGQAVERLAKAEVVARDPEGLTRPNKVDSVQFLRGEGHPSIDHLGAIWTFPGPDATRKAFDCMGLTAPDPLDLAAVFNARNASAHLGFADELSAGGALGAMVRLVRALLAPAGLTIGGWIEEPDLEAIADILAGIAAGPTSRRLGREAQRQSKLFVARETWKELKQRLPTDMWLQLATSPKKPELAGEEVTLEPCPTVGHMAWFTVLWETSETQDNNDAENLRDEIATLGTMGCDLCGLELDAGDVYDLGLDRQVDQRTVEQ